MQTQSPLINQNGHLFARIEGKDWVVDTGSPISFGNGAALQLAGQSFAVTSGYMGLTAAALSGFIGHPAEGIIGTDILNRLDVDSDTQTQHDYVLGWNDMTITLYEQDHSDELV